MFYYDRVKSGNEANLAVVDQHLRKRGMGRWMRSEFYRFLENIESNVQNIGGNVDNYMFDEWAHEFVKAYEAHGVEIPALQIDESVGKQKDVELAMPIGAKKKKKKQKSLSQEEQKTLQEKQNLVKFIIAARDLTNSQKFFNDTKTEFEKIFQEMFFNEFLLTTINEKLGNLIQESEVSKDIVQLNEQFESKKKKEILESSTLAKLSEYSDKYFNTPFFTTMDVKPIRFAETDLDTTTEKIEDYKNATETLFFLEKWLTQTIDTLTPVENNLKKIEAMGLNELKRLFLLDQSNEDVKGVKNTTEKILQDNKILQKQLDGKFFEGIQFIVDNYSHSAKLGARMTDYDDHIKTLQNQSTQQFIKMQKYFDFLKNNDEELNESDDKGDDGSKTSSNEAYTSSSKEDSDGSSDEDDFDLGRTKILENQRRRFELETRALERKRYLESFAQNKRDFQKKLREEKLEKETTLKQEETKRIQRQKQEFEERAQKHEYIFPNGGGSSVLFHERYDNFKKQKGKPYVRRENENERLRVGGKNEKKMLKEQAKKRTEQAIQNRSKGIEIKANGIKPKDLWRYLPQGNSAYSIQKVEFTKKSVPLEEARKLEEMNKAIEEERELEEIIKAVDLIGSSVSARPPIRAENLPFARFIGKKIEAQL